MEDKLIGLEVAKLAKEKGLFISKEEDYAFTALYSEGKGCRSVAKKFYPNYKELYFEVWNDCYLFPTQSLLQKWLREIHNIHIEIYANHSGWGWILTKTNGTTIKDIEDWTFFESYEEALGEGLMQALNLVTHNWK